MQTPPKLTDRPTLLRNRARALRMDEPAMFLQQEAILEVQERLALINKTFTSPVIVTGFPELWKDAIPGARIIADDDVLDLEPNGHDLVIHAMALHWANDPVGQLIQARRALIPDGLFIGICFGGQTLCELRAVISEAEIKITGGLSPHVVPMAEIREIGALLQRAEFALPVADNFTRVATYESALKLMTDLRAMGEGNALLSRNRVPFSREMLRLAEQKYTESFSKNGRISATFEFVVVTGWAPDDSQQKPLRPGSAISRLSDALGATESSL